MLLLSILGFALCGIWLILLLPIIPFVSFFLPAIVPAVGAGSHASIAPFVGTPDKLVILRYVSLALVGISFIFKLASMSDDVWSQSAAMNGVALGYNMYGVVQLRSGTGSTSISYSSYANSATGQAVNQTALIRLGGSLTLIFGVASLIVTFVVLVFALLKQFAPSASSSLPGPLGSSIFSWRMLVIGAFTSFGAVCFWGFAGQASLAESASNSSAIVLGPSWIIMFVAMMLNIAAIAAMHVSIQNEKDDGGANVNADAQQPQSECSTSDPAAASVYAATGESSA